MATTIQREGLPDQQMHEVHRIECDGAIDADGHILEPPDLWDEYLESKYKDRALRIRVDENGLEELEIGGQRSTMSRRGFPATLGAMGAPVRYTRPTPRAPVEIQVGKGAYLARKCRRGPRSSLAGGPNHAYPRPLNRPGRSPQVGQRCHVMATYRGRCYGRLAPMKCSSWRI